ncbi:MAG: hypothetical protein HY720_16990 [Planctomycetes bacterium]|nr:hypothetical protein [Planctomycetota bacterium]
MFDSTLRQALLSHLADRGFNLTGVASAARFDSLAPPGRRLRDRWAGVRSAVVFATGGHAFWDEVLPRALGRSPAGLDDPIDDYSRHIGLETLAIVRRHGARGKCCHPFGGEEGEGAAGTRRATGDGRRGTELPNPKPRTPSPGRGGSSPPPDEAAAISFPRLAEAAGLGAARTVLGILIHPVYGPWVSLRGALLVDEDLEPTPAADFDPCPACEKPCLAACPVSAFHPELPWDAGACAAHLAASEECHAGCLSRMACVVGPEHRYSPAEYRHRHRLTVETLLGRAGARRLEAKL